MGGREEEGTIKVLTFAKSLKTLYLRERGEEGEERERKGRGKGEERERKGREKGERGGRGRGEN